MRKRLRILPLLILLTLLFVFTGACANLPGDTDPEATGRNGSEASPPTEEPPVSLADPDRWRGKKIAVLGDSITELNGFQRYLEELLGAEVLSYGVSGTTISGSRDRSFLSRVAQIDKSADLVIVFGGTNDFHFNLPLGERDNAKTSYSTFYGSLKLLNKYLNRRVPDAAYVFLTPLQRVMSAEDCTGDKNALGLTLEDYVQAILDVCAEAGIPVLDLYHQSAITRGTAGQYLYDGLHPNAAGFEVLGEEIAAYLASMD